MSGTKMSGTICKPLDVSVLGNKKIIFWLLHTLYHYSQLILDEVVLSHGHIAISIDTKTPIQQLYKVIGYLYSSVVEYIYNNKLNAESDEFKGDELYFSIKTKYNLDVDAIRKKFSTIFPIIENIFLISHQLEKIIPFIIEAYRSDLEMETLRNIFQLLNTAKK